MSSAIVASVGGAIVGGKIASKGSEKAAAAAATKDNASSTAGFENQTGTNNVAATLKSLGYSDEQIKELAQSAQQQQTQQNTSQTGQTQTSNTGTKSDTTAQNQTSTGNQSTTEQLTNNLSQTSQSSQTQGAILNQFQAGNTNPAQQLFNSTAGGISPEQYKAIVDKAGLDLQGQVPGLTRALATASGTSNANNSGLAIGLEQAKQNAAITAAQQSVAASQGAQQIAAGAAGTIAGATTGNNQTLQQWQQQQQSMSQQQQAQQVTGQQVNNTNTATTGTSNQVSQDLTNQLATQTGSQTGSTNTTGTQSTDRSNQATTQQNTNQNQSTVSTGSSQYGEGSATNVDSLVAPVVSVPGHIAPGAGTGPLAPTVIKTPQTDFVTQDVYDGGGYAEGGLISGGGSALPGRASGKGTANANGTPGNAAAAQILMQDATRKANAVNNAAGVLSKYFATPLTDKDGKQLKNSDGTPIYPAQNITDALKSATGVGDFFNRLGGEAVSKSLTGAMNTSPAFTPQPAPIAGAFGDGFDGFAAGFAEGGLISGPGTGTSDSIPAVVDGKTPIAVSDGEYVIPTHVVEAVGVDYFDNLLAHFKNAKI